MIEPDLKRKIHYHLLDGSHLDETIPEIMQRFWNDLEAFRPLHDKCYGGPPFTPEEENDLNTLSANMAIAAAVLRDNDILLVGAPAPASANIVGGTAEQVRIKAVDDQDPRTTH